MADERMGNMRQRAIGRVQSSSHLRVEATMLLTDAIRAAHKAGAPKTQLLFESGLTRAEVDRILAGKAL